MTDLYDEFAGNSNMLELNEEKLKKGINNLFEQIKLFESKNVNIICFGD